MNSLSTNFISKFINTSKPLIFGMVHLPALPGTPANKLNPDEILRFVSNEVKIYKECKVDGIILENMNDIPYLHSTSIGPEVTSMMTACAMKTVNVLSNERDNFLLGIQVLAGCNKEALSIAFATGFNFIRAESFVYSHIADEGLMNACAGDLLRFRKTIGAEKVGVVVDIKKKHCSHSITSDLSVADVAEGADFFRADGVILTGMGTGKEADSCDISLVQKVTKLPVLIGSGVTIENMVKYKDANGFIIGTHFKENGDWRNKLSRERITNFVKALRSL
uniref:BtpA family membrane complex biogenesis protein n=1 Tax=Parastrongyloides trichosuri TaxID=131310 RepID=A0A0N4Z616_PARTI